MIKHLLYGFLGLVVAVDSSFGENFSTTASALSASVATIEQAEAELILGPPDMDGTVPAIVRLTLADGFKTYWHVPGDGGLPPIVSVAGMSLDLHLPAPKRIVDEYGEALGYKSAVSIAFDVPPSSAAGGEVAVDMIVGVCAEICIPFIASLSAPVPTMTVARDAMALMAAERALPQPFADDLAVQSAGVTAHEDGVVLEAQLVLPDAALPAEADLFVRIDGREEFFGKAAVWTPGSEGAQVNVDVVTSLATEELFGRTATFTLVYGDRAVEGAVVLR